MSCWCVRGLKSGRRTARQGRFGGKGGKGSPTLLSHLNAESVPDPSLSTVDGSGSESVKSLRRRKTHVHLNQRCIYTGPYLLLRELASPSFKKVFPEPMEIVTLIAMQ